MWGWGCVKRRSGCNTLLCHTESGRNGILLVGKRFCSSQGQRGYPSEIKQLWRFKLPFIPENAVFGSKNTPLRYVHNVKNDPDLNRDFFVQLWLVDRKKTMISGKRRHKALKSVDSGETLVNGQSLPGLIDRIFSGKYDEMSHDKMKSGFKQPPTSQSITGVLEPMSSEEVMVSCLL